MSPFPLSIIDGYYANGNNQHLFLFLCFDTVLLKQVHLPWTGCNDVTYLCPSKLPLPSAPALQTSFPSSRSPGYLFCLTWLQIGTPVTSSLGWEFAVQLIELRLLIKEYNRQPGGKAGKESFCLFGLDAVLLVQSGGCSNPIIEFGYRLTRARWIIIPSVALFSSL